MGITPLKSRTRPCVPEGSGKRKGPSVPAFVGVEPDELGGGVCDDPEAAGIGAVKVAPKLIGGLDAVPEPARPGLDDRVVFVGFGTSDDLGV